MTTRIWTITTELTGVDREVNVLLFDSTKNMRQAASRWLKAEGVLYGMEWKPGTYNHALAAMQGMNIVHVSDGGVETPEPLAGRLLLVRGYLTPEIISHEVVHLAMHLYGLDFLAGMGGVKDIHDYFNGGNEDFAYLYGGLFATVWDMLKEEMA